VNLIKEKKLSDDHKIKMSEAHKGKSKSEETKRKMKQPSIKHSLLKLLQAGWVVSTICGFPVLVLLFWQNPLLIGIPIIMFFMMYFETDKRYSEKNDHY